MKTYMLSLGGGILVGLIYSLLNVRSPAPPLVALIGLLGILLGEQVIPVARQMLAGGTLAVGSYDQTIRLWDWRAGQVTKHLTGQADKVYSLAYTADGKRIASGGPRSTWNHDVTM